VVERRQRRESNKVKLTADHATPSFASCAASDGSMPLKYPQL
jgi:hypothetical protein